MISIRLMSENDLDSVARLDVLAFSEYDQSTGDVVSFSPRTHQNLLASLSLNPSGCFVAETDEPGTGKPGTGKPGTGRPGTGRPIGYLFSRIWGKVGWIGVFGVDPAHQCQNVGQMLLSAGIDGLKEANCQTIGLETRSDKTYNIGFYTGRGFRLSFPTLGMVKAVSPPPEPAAYVSWSELKELDALCAVSQVSEAAQSGLDYTPEAKNAADFRWGETLFFGWPKPWALAVIRTASRRQAKSGKICEIDALAIHPDYTDCFEHVLQTVEGFAIEQNVSKMQLSINTVDGDTLKRILEYGFRVDSVMARMTMEKQIRLPPNGIDLSRWAM